MPTYTFRNTETGETFDQFMSMSSREQYLKDNPKLETVIGAVPTIRDTPRVPDGFREVLQKVHHGMPGSVLKDNIR
jgi:hypothetical protein